MADLKYYYCVENKAPVDKIFKIPKNENAPEHLKMEDKPIVYIMKDAKLPDLLKYCAVPVIDPLVLSTIFIQFWPEEATSKELWTSFGLRIGREGNEEYQTSLRDLFDVREKPHHKREIWEFH